MYHLKVGDIFDQRYILTQRIGTGASGEVWLARDQQIPRNVALKVMNVSLTTQQIHLERFQREISSLNELGNSHPNIPQLYGANTTSERPYIVMEYIGGASLKDLIDTQYIHQLSFKKRITHMIQHIADALSYAHDRDIVHRDIKPENVKIMGDADRTYLLDFSIAVLNAAETRSGVGTPKYLAPEVASSPAADIFSFGLVCYEILFGRHPIYEIDELVRGPYQAQEILQDRLSKGKWHLPSKTATLMPNRPTDMDWAMIDVVFQQVLALDPNDRPTHALAVAEGLIAAINTETTSEILMSKLKAERESRQIHDPLGAILDSSQHTQLDPPPPPSPLPSEVSVDDARHQTIPAGLATDDETQKWIILTALGMLIFMVGIVVGTLLA